LNVGFFVFDVENLLENSPRGMLTARTHLFSQQVQLQCPCRTIQETVLDHVCTRDS
jgi:hypothetical protein